MLYILPANLNFLELRFFGYDKKYSQCVPSNKAKFKLTQKKETLH